MTTAVPATVSPSSTSSVGAVGSGPIGTAQVAIDTSAELLLAAADGTAFESWASQNPAAAMEAEFFRSLKDIKARSSAVVVARLGRELPPNVFRGDEGTDDVITIPRFELTIVESLAGTRSLEAGQVLVLEFALGFPAPPEDQTAIFFLRYMPDGFDGRPNPEWAWMGDVWRIVNSQGLVVDSGAGRPLNPIAAAAAWASGDQGRDLEEFAGAVYDPASSNDPVEREVAAMTTAELLGYLRAGSG